MSLVGLVKKPVMDLLTVHWLVIQLDFKWFLATQLIVGRGVTNQLQGEASFELTCTLIAEYVRPRVSLGVSHWYLLQEDEVLTEGGSIDGPAEFYTQQEIDGACATAYKFSTNGALAYTSAMVCQAPGFDYSNQVELMGLKNMCEVSCSLSKMTVNHGMAPPSRVMKASGLSEGQSLLQTTKVVVKCLSWRFIVVAQAGIFICVSVAHLTPDL
ncbi:hypothetical protein L7F22_064027 [Adiantum nelumboides]|nr:hypothetical protein [Adiantum nelumboides]